MKISVILPVYNVELYLKACIDSVLSQTYQNFELIAINDGSTDASFSILNQYTDTRIVVLEQENQGVAATLNRGLKKATGEYVAFIDGDDLWVKDKLENQVRIFDENPAFEISFGKIEQFLSEELIGSEARFRFEEKPASGFAKITCLARKEVFRKYGFFANVRTSDFILWFDDARSLGLKYHLSENTFAYRRIRENSLSQQPEYYPTLLRFMKEKLDKKRNEAAECKS